MKTPEPAWNSEVGGTKRKVPSRVMVTAAVAIVIVVIVLLAVMLSQDYLPSTSIHDADGDGVADHNDAFPDDPTEWADEDGNGVGDNFDLLLNDPLNWRKFFTFDVDDILGDYGAVCIWALAEVPWSELRICISDEVSLECWNSIDPDGFDEYTLIQNVGTLSLGTCEVRLLAKEMQRNDNLGVGDYLMFKIEDQLSETVTLQVWIIHDPTGTELALFELR